MGMTHAFVTAVAVLVVAFAGPVVAARETGETGNVIGVGDDGSLNINGTKNIYLRSCQNGTVHIGCMDVLATLLNLTTEVRAIQIAGGVPQHQWVESHVDQHISLCEVEAHAGPTLGVDDGDHWRISSWADIYVQPARNSTVFVRTMDLLAALSNITSSVQALRQGIGEQEPFAGVDTMTGARASECFQLAEEEMTSTSNVAVEEDGTLFVLGGGDIRMNPGLNGTVLVGGIDVSGAARDLTVALRQVQAIANNVTTTPCGGSTVKTLDCSSPSSRQEIARLHVCEVAEVVECCCEEFYALTRVNGRVRVARGVTHLRFGDVQEIGGDVLVPGSSSSPGVLASINFGAVVWIGGTVEAADNAITSLVPGSLAIVEGSVYLHRNAFNSVNFGNLTSVGGNMRLSGNPLTSIHLGALSRIGGYLWISNTDLNNINFGSLTSVGGYLWLHDNAMTSVDFGSLARVDGALFLSDNTLANINFGSLTHVGGSLSLRNNVLSRVSLGPLSNLDNSLDLSDNSLSSVDCSGLAACVCSDAGVSLTNCPNCCTWSRCGC